MSTKINRQQQDKIENNRPKVRTDGQPQVPHNHARKPRMSKEVEDVKNEMAIRGDHWPKGYDENRQPSTRRIPNMHK